MVNWQDVFAAAQRDFSLVLPQIMLAFFALATLLTDFLLGPKEKGWNAFTAMIGVVFSGISLVLLRSVASQPISAFNDSIVVDRFFILFAGIFLALAAMAIALSVRYLKSAGEQRGEYYALMLLAVAGMMFVACANDLVLLFIALEATTMCSYTLVVFMGATRKSHEGALKFVLLGAFSSAVLAYGFSLLYGLSGSTNLGIIAGRITERGAGDFLALLAIITVAAGALFKGAIVPFHHWAPDVYESAPTTVAAFLSAGSMAVSFVLLLRLFVTVFWPLRVDWIPIVEIAAILSLVLGNLAAVTQSNIYRLLAYSSISHAGYVLLGLVAAVSRDGSLHTQGLESTIFYLFQFAFFNTGAFALLIVLQRKGCVGEELEDLNGLFRRSPGSAILMVIFVLSLLGVPPTAGFIAKLMIFSSLATDGHMGLAVLATICIAPAIYYYFRIVFAMLEPGEAQAAPVLITWIERVALAAMALVTLTAGIYPQPFLQMAARSVLMPPGH